MKIELDMYQTLAVAVLVLMLGKFLRARVQVLERFCIPAPVIGGVLFAIFTCVCYVTGVAEFAFDDILKELHRPQECLFGRSLPVLFLLYLSL